MLKFLIMKKIFSICLFISSTCFFGQNQKEESFRNSTGDFKTSGSWLPATKIDNSIEGSPYLFDGCDGFFKIFIDEKKYYPTGNLNYNISSKVLESKISKDSIFQYDLKAISFVKRGEEKYVFCTIDKKVDFCLEIYSSSKIVFVKDFKLALINGTLNPLTQEMRKSRYEKRQEYFCKVANNEFVEVDLKKKPILKLLGEKSKLVEKYASDSKLSFSSEKDLVKIFKYYDSL